MKVASYLNSLFVFLFALFLFIVAITPAYEAFMHPRFRPLTLITAYIFLALSVLVLSNGSTPAKPLQYLALGLVLFTLGTAVVVLYPRNAAPYAAESAAPVESPLPAIDERFMPISIPEIYLFTLETEDPLAGMGLAFRGVVLKSPDLDRQGLVAIGRVYLSCCAADAARLIFLLEMPDSVNPDNFRDGEWVAVNGRLSKVTSDIKQIATAELSPDSFASLDVINPSHYIVAQEVGPTPAPAEFFIDRLATHEPFSY